MKLTKVEVFDPRRPNYLASVRIELSDDNGGPSIIIDDLRVLRNKQGQNWLALPAYSVPEGRTGYRYEPVLTLPRDLKRTVEDAVLTEFERWERTQS